MASPSSFLLSTSGTYSAPSMFPKPRRSVPAVLSAVLLAQSISGGGGAAANEAPTSAEPVKASSHKLFGKIDVAVPEFSGDSSTYWKWLNEEVFNAFDANKDGNFDASEIGTKNMKHLGVDEDGKITRGEMTLTKALLLFSTLDTDG